MTELDSMEAEQASSHGLRGMRGVGAPDLAPSFNPEIL